MMTLMMMHKIDSPRNSAKIAEDAFMTIMHVAIFSNTVNYVGNV